MKAHWLDFGLFQETNKNWSTELCRSLQRLFFLDGPAKMITASESAQREVHLPGGCLMVAKGNHAGRIFKQHSDRLGRYCYAAMHGKDGGGIILINLYRITQNKGVKAGIKTSYMRQRNTLRMSGDHNPDPKNQVLADVTDIIQEWSQRGFHPIVAGDFTSEPSDPPMVQFIERNELIDLVADSNDDVFQLTCNRGSKRIDLILGDAFIRKAVIKSRSLEENNGFFSEHTMQWVDLSTKDLFKSKRELPSALNTRDFVLTNAKKKHAFQDKFDKLNAYHKVEAKKKKLRLILRASAKMNRMGTRENAL